ncbi:MAG TPA: hypothetical protein DCR46_05645 [Cytophagales bacterium]|nr:hypothetical protein [Cytophagales bacterium]
MNGYSKHFFSSDILGATLFILGILWGVSNINYNFEILSPMQDMFGDFEVTDLAASKVREEAQEDTNIVLVNIGGFSREQIAQQVRIINSYKPKVIGVDSFFRRLKDPESDSVLASAFDEVENLVLVSKLLYDEEKKVFDSLESSHPIFLRNSKLGFANLITEGEENFRTARVFSPFDTVTKNGAKQNVETFFALKVAEIYKPGSSKKLAERRLKLGYDFEHIRFKGNLYGVKAKYYAIDAQDILDSNFSPDLIRSKIVLMGYMGNEISQSENIWDIDKFFTPLNDKYVGKAIPDMFGVVVHANIISMILNEQYVNVAPFWFELVLTFIMCYISVAMFNFVLVWQPMLFDPLTKMVQFIVIIALMFLEAYVYLKKSYVIDFGAILLAVALAPDFLEIYVQLLKRLVAFFKEKLYIREKFQS